MSMMSKKLKFVLQFLLRNQTRKKDYDLGNGIKLFYWRLSSQSENLGDYLSKVVVTHLISKKVKESSIKNRKTLYAIGSIIGLRCQNAVVWGSGILTENPNIQQFIRHSLLDIRAVRGPKTRQLLLDWGKNCPEVYGDPAILMPLIYTPKKTEKKYKVSLVFHHEHNKFSVPENQDIHMIDIKTEDYEHVIDEIAQSSLVISSSLHGIILAEAYGVPAITLLKKEAITFKFEDWYFSTGRQNITMARSIEEALLLQPMDLPELSIMQKQIINAFPWDLWGK